jgi:hypothetical protein
MAIDKSGRWWKGATAKDALQYLRSLEPGGYTVDEVLAQKCKCGSCAFHLYWSEENELRFGLHWVQAEDVYYRLRGIRRGPRIRASQVPALSVNARRSMHLPYSVANC